MDLLFLCEASTSIASPYSQHQEMRVVSVNSVMQVCGVVALVQGTVFSYDLLWGRQGPCPERTERTRPLLIVDACLCVLGKRFVALRGSGLARCCVVSSHVRIPIG